MGGLVDSSVGFPVFRAIADTAVLVEFGTQIDDAIHARVVTLDAVVGAADIIGVTELMPSFTALYVGYDPLVTDYASVLARLQPLINEAAEVAGQAQHWQVPVCYAPEHAPDMDAVCAQLDMTPEQVVAHHVSGTYKVYMYGFAPGYAYLGGVPQAIQIPRKSAPVMGVPSGVVMIAGPQALITTVTMPTGWWRIGRTGMTPLQNDPDRPFLFDVGDSVEFVEMDAAEFARHGQVAS